MMKRILALLIGLAVASVPAFAEFNEAVEVPETEPAVEVSQPESEEIPDAAEIPTDTEETLTAEAAELPEGEETEEAEAAEEEPETKVTAALDRTDASICVGDSWTKLNVVYSDGSDVNADGTPRTVVFTSSKTKYVRVDENGTLYGAASGKATVTAQVSYEGKSEALICGVKVSKAPKSVSLSPKIFELDLGVNETAALQVTYNKKGMTPTLHFASSDESVAVVNESGVVTALSKGAAQITVETANGKNAAAQLEVFAPVSSVSLDKASITLGQGMTYAFTAETPEHERDTYSWESSAPGIVSVNADGVVAAVEPGTAVITVTAVRGGVSASCEVTVVKGPEDLVLRSDTLQLGKGNTYDLLESGFATVLPADALTTLSVKSSKTSVVAVDGTTLKAKKTGKAIITVTTANGCVRTFMVNVLKYPSSFKLSASKITLGPGMSQTVSVIFGKKTASAYTCVSSDPEVASVDPYTGLVTARSAGSCEITFACVSGTKKASCAVTVLPAPQTVGVTEAEIRGYAGKTGLAVQGVYPEGTMCGFTYEVISGAESVGVDPNTGSLTLIKEGSAVVKITAVNAPAATAECTVYVCPAPDDVSVSDYSITLGKGNTCDLIGEGIISLSPSNAQTDFTFATSSKKYVTVSADGIIKGVKRGSAKIRVVTANGIEKVIAVTVMNYPKTMQLDQKTLTLAKGMKDQLTVSFGKKTYSRYYFTSSDESVVTVEPDSGAVTAVGAGTAVITCVCTTGNRSANCKVTVLPDPTTVFFDRDTYCVAEGKQIKVSASVDVGSMSVFTYTSSDNSIATVDADGTVTGIANGTVELTVTTLNGLNAKCTVTVMPAPKALQPAYDVLTIAVGERSLLEFKVIPDGTTAEFTYASSAPTVVKIDSDGMLYGMASGTAVITVTSDNGLTCNQMVTVVPWYQLHTDVLSVAHRGASGDYPPGNSITAFSHAKELGADMIELDVQRSSDGVIFVRHDTTMNINGTLRALSGLKYSVITAHDSNVCTLEEALNCIKSYGLKLEIELKTTGYESEVMSLVRSCGMESRTAYGSFNISTLSAMKAMDASAQTIYILNKSSVLNGILKDPASYPIDSVSASYSLLSETVVRNLHLDGFDVMAWTVNSATLIEKMKTIGVDEIITDYPENV